MTDNKKVTIHKEVIIVSIFTTIMICLEIYTRVTDAGWDKLPLGFYIFTMFFYSLNVIPRLWKGYNLKKQLTKKNKIAVAMATTAVIILAIPSENNSYTECGVGSVYTKHYYDDDGYRELSSKGCDLTVGGAIKLTGSFVAFFYLSLLVLERREKENEIETKLQEKKQESNEDIQLKFDDASNDSINDSFENDDDYKNIPF